MKKRIRPGDVSLVFSYYRNVVIVITLLIFIPCLVYCILKSKSSLDVVLYPFFAAIAVGTVTAYLIYKRFPEHHKTLIHRELLAKMIVENKWYTSDTRKREGFFKDIRSNQTKEVITEFPKVYYQFQHNMIYITVKLTMGKYQEQLLNLEKKLETGLFCECIMKELKEYYMEYTFLYNMLDNRISIDEVECKDGKLKLMKNLWWNYDAMPHMLCIGGTGGGKTYFILTLIETLLRTNAVLYIFDPKRSDLADLGTILPNVYSDKEGMISCLQNFYEDMMQRTEDMKRMPNYRTGKNYAYLGLEAHFLIFDEYVAFIEMLDRTERDNVLTLMKKIVMLGRQMGYFLILACQRPDAKYLGDGIRDQFNFRVALGRNSELGYGMVFGDTDKDFFMKDIKGRGYLDSGVGVITEFYTPQVPPEHDFMEEIGCLQRMREKAFETETFLSEEGITESEEEGVAESEDVSA